jgi:hypothetical protein
MPVGGIYGFAEALGTKLKEKKRCNFSENKAAVTLRAQSLLSPLFSTALADLELRKGKVE